jgi:hypothetical protein
MDMRTPIQVPTHGMVTGAPHRRARRSSDPRSILGGCAATLAASLLGACDLDGAEASRVDVPVVIETSAKTVILDDHWSLELDHCRGVVENLVFTSGGAWYSCLSPALVRTAWAHAGHQGGGEVIGELPGRHVIDWCASDHEGRVLGVAQVLGYDIQAASFSWARATADDVSDDDPLLGRSLALEGRLVQRDAQGELLQTREFAASLELPWLSGVVGVPMPDIDVPREGDVFAFAFETAPWAADPQRAPLDESFFAALDMTPWLEAEVDVIIEPGSPDHDRLRDTALQHDYYRIGHADAVE